MDKLGHIFASHHTLLPGQKTVGFNAPWHCICAMPSSLYWLIDRGDLCFRLGWILISNVSVCMRTLAHYGNTTYSCARTAEIERTCQLWLFAQSAENRCAWAKIEYFIVSFDPLTFIFRIVNKARLNVHTKNCMSHKRGSTFDQKPLRP